MVTKRQEWGEGIVREFGMDMYALLYLKWVTNKVLLYSTGKSAQCYRAAWMGGGCIHVYVWLSPFAVHLKLSQRCWSVVFQYKTKTFKKLKMKKCFPDFCWSGTKDLFRDLYQLVRRKLEKAEENGKTQRITCRIWWMEKQTVLI